MSYLDIARAISTGHPSAAIHAYWSPGYPILLSLFLWVFHPGIYWEFPFVHFVNVLIFIGTIVCFQLFWAKALRCHKEFAEVDGAAIPDNAFWALGYAAFCIATLNVIRVGLVGPDLLVAAFCFLAGWSLLNFRRGPNLYRAVLLGAVLALGYYVKAPFFPVGVVFVLCACTWRPLSSRTALHVGTAMATFLLVCAPFIIALSFAKGRLTFGDSARMSQAFYINGVQYYAHWQGGPTGSGTPVHSTRKLDDFPEIFEYAANDMGTYPPWFDPTYWYEGITPHPVLQRQAALLVRNLALELQIVLDYGATLVCVLVVLILLSGFSRWSKRLGKAWFVWVPGACALAMFASIHIEIRFLGGWLVLLFAGGLCACSLPWDRGTLRAAWCIGAGALATAVALVILQASREAIGNDHAIGRNAHDVSIAAFLLNEGLHPGDRVALIGDGSVAFWAHLARLQLVAEIPARSASLPIHPVLDFWQSGPAQQQKALRILEGTGAKAIVAGSQQSVLGSAPSTLPAPWEKIDGTDAYVYFFHANP